MSPKGDSGPSRVVLNATLQLNADDNSEEQIIRIRDKGAREASSSSSSTLLDNEHQVSGSSKGPATLNLHGSDTIVNISTQVGVISGTRTTTTLRPLTSASVKRVAPAPMQSASQPGEDEQKRKGAGHRHHSSSSPWEDTDEEGDEDQDEDDEEEVAVKGNATTTATVSKAHKNVIASRGSDNDDHQDEQKESPANGVINANYTDGNGAGRKVPSEVEKVVPHEHHGSVMNIERAIGENGEQMIIIAGEEDDEEVVNVHKNHFVEEASLMASQHKSDPADDSGGVVDEPIALPLRPIIRDPFDEMDDEAHHGEMTIVYAELRSEVTINCEVDMDIALNTWFHDGQVSGVGTWLCDGRDKIP